MSGSADGATILGVPTPAALAGAELRKLFSRTSARVGTALVALIAVGVPLLAFVLQRVVRGAVDDPTVADAVVVDSSQALVGVLGLKSFFLFRAMVIWVIAETISGELAARTLREDLVRPVSREQVLFAKWAAIQGFVALGTLLPAVIATVMSLVLFGTTGDLEYAARGFAVTWLGDVGFATMVIAIAFFVRSVSGTLAGVLVYWILDQTLGWILWGLETARPQLGQLLEMGQMQGLGPLLDVLIQIRPWLPSAAFNLPWATLPSGDAPASLWQSYVALVVIIVASLGLARTVFRRLDID